MALRNAYANLEALRERVRKTNVDVDAQLERALNAASRAVDRYTGRRFWLDATPTTRTLEVDVCTNELSIPDVGDRAGVSLEVDVIGGRTFVPVPASDYYLWPEDADQADPVVEPFTAIRRINLSTAAIFVGGSAIRVTGRFGWPGTTVANGVVDGVPDDVVEATLIKATRLFRRKDTPEGVAGSADTGVVRISRHDGDVVDLLEPLTRQDGRHGQAGIG